MSHPAPDSTLWCCRLLRQAAAAAATAELEDILLVGSAATLLSPLLAELCQGLQGLSLTSPSHALADLPAFLSRTRMRHLEISARGPAASAQADRVLRHCDTITSLACRPPFLPHFWPPSLTHLELVYVYVYDWTRITCAAAAAKVQHVQLLRMQDASALRQLSIITGPICEWPADLAGSLPGRLEKVHLGLCVPKNDALLLSEAAVDLSAFSQAAGCTAELEVFIHACGLFHEKDAFLAGFLAGVCAVGSFHLLCLYWTLEGVAAHVLELSQLQCSRCVISCEHLAHVCQLPALGHLTLLAKSWPADSEPLTCEWAALASPGVRCLGSAAQPTLGLVIKGCCGLPAHAQPWALAIWADMSKVQGVPVDCFVEKAPGMHLWRNNAGAGLLVELPPEPADWEGRKY